ncbi:MAG: Methyltransferase type 11 [Hyphomicrobiales bacterium]|nr:Methyltransferase type 11 [Hyphomicrobiales bacterium]
MVDGLKTRIKRKLRKAALRWGSFRRLTPISRFYGYDRGTPLDRVYIERFLADNRSSIRGHVLEVKDGSYTQRFGTGVTRGDVLDVDATNARATIIADLNNPEALPAAIFDCIVLTQTLQFVFDLRSALAALSNSLKPGGVLLVTVPGITRSAIGESDGKFYLGFTLAGVRRLFRDFFPPEDMTVSCYGNVLAATAFLHGLAAEELTETELLHADHEFPVIICVRATRHERGLPG